MTATTHFKPTGRQTALALAMALTLPAVVVPVEAAPVQPSTSKQANTLPLAIAAGALEAALVQFSTQTGITVSFTPDVVQGRKTGGLNGNFSVGEGLNRLLAGSGLRAQALPNGTYSVMEAEANMLPPVQISSTVLTAVTEGSGSYTTGSTSSATGLALSPRETPQSITVVTRDRMTDQNLTSISDVMQQIVGIQGNTTSALGSDGVSYVARGFDVENYLVDGVPRPTVIYAFSEETSDMVAYDRIEVIRGSSGLMSGMGYPSASINLIRKRPTAEASGSVNAQVGSWDLLRLETDLSGSLNQQQNIRGRVALSYQENDYFIDREQHDRVAGYGIVEADLGDSTTLSAGIEYQDFQNTGASRGGVPLFYTDGSRTSLSRSTNSGTEWSEFNRESTNLFATLQHQLTENWQLSLHAEHKQGLYDETLGYVYARHLDRNTGEGGIMYISRWAGDLELSALNASLTGTFELFGRQHDLTVNAFRAEYDEDGDDYPGWWTGLPAQPVPDALTFFNTGKWPKPDLSATGSTFGKDVDTSALSSALRLHLMDPLHVIVGMRISDWRQDTWTKTAAGVKTTTNVTDESGIVTPYFGVVGDLSDTLSAYASYTNIFEPQSKQTLSGDTLDPLEGNNYEVGLKAEFMNGKLNASVAVFQMQQENYAIALGEGIYAPDGSIAYSAEDGLEATGYELEVSGELAPGWQVIGGFANARLDDADGKQINRHINENSFKLFSTYELNSLVQGLKVGGNLHWQDQGVAEDVGPNGEDFKQGSLFLVDLLARFKVNEHLTVSANINNVFDKEYYSGMWYIGRYGEPRNVRISARWTF